MTTNAGRRRAVDPPLPPLALRADCGQPLGKARPAIAREKFPANAPSQLRLGITGTAAMASRDESAPADSQGPPSTGETASAHSLHAGMLCSAASMVTFRSC